MNNLPIPEFQRAIRVTHGIDCELIGRERVVSQFKNVVAWEGEVLVFGQHGLPRCYAWEVDGKVTAVLHEPPVDSPHAAVRAAIVNQYRRQKEN